MTKEWDIDKFNPQKLPTVELIHYHAKVHAWWKKL